MPFYANYGYHLKLDLLNISQMDNLVAKYLASRLSELQETIKLHLQEAQDHFKTYADMLSKESPLLKGSEKVWLLWCNTKTTQLCDKLDYCRLRAISYPKAN